MSTVDAARQAANEKRITETLDTQVRVNGSEFMTRRALIEWRVAAGAYVTERRGERVLMNPDGSWLDTRNITKIGLDYAERLVGYLDADSASDISPNHDAG